MKNLSEFDGFYVQSNTLLSADILENFRNTCLEIWNTHKKLKESLNYGYVLKKVDKIIKFNQKDWFKQSIDMNTELQKKANIYFGKDFFNLSNNVIFGKTIGNIRKHGDMKLVTHEVRRNCLVCEPNYHTRKIVWKAIEIKKNIFMNLSIFMIFMNKPVYHQYWNV